MRRRGAKSEVSEKGGEPEKEESQKEGEPKVDEVRYS